MKEFLKYNRRIPHCLEKVVGKNMDIKALLIRTQESVEDDM